MNGNVCVCKHQKKQPNKARQFKAWPMLIMKDNTPRTAFAAVESRSVFTPR